MVVYAPGTQEKDQQKQNMALQEHARQIDVSNASIATLQTVATHLAAPLTNSLGADVLLNDTTKYFDGPSVAQGTSGIFFASGTVTVFDSATAVIYCKLWDGTTVIASACIVILNTTTTESVSLSGSITNPAGNIRISVRDISNTSGKIDFNQTGNSKDSTLTVIQLG